MQTFDLEQIYMCTPCQEGLETSAFQMWLTFPSTYIYSRRGVGRKKMKAVNEERENATLQPGIGR